MRGEERSPTASAVRGRSLLFGSRGPIATEDTLPEDLGLLRSEAQQSLGGLAPLTFFESATHQFPRPSVPERSAGVQFRG